MATTYTSFAEAQNKALSDYSEAPNLRQNGGTVHHLDVTVTQVGATANPLYLARLPKGARLLPQLCSVDYADPGDALTCKIGDEADDDRYGALLALGGAAGRKRFDEATTKGDAFLNPHTLVDDAWIIATFTTATNAVSAQQTWHLAYTLA
jgi:hypothetical protein